MNNDDALGTILENPTIYLRKKKTLKLCVDPSFLNSITKLVSIPLAIEPLHILLTRVTGKNFSVCDLSNAHHRVPLTKESQKVLYLTSETNNTLIVEASVSCVVFQTISVD